MILLFFIFEYPFAERLNTIVVLYEKVCNLIFLWKLILISNYIIYAGLSINVMG